VNTSDIASVLRQIWGAGSVFHAMPRVQTVVGQTTSESSQTPRLTERERTTLEAVTSGMTTSAISTELWVSGHTVKFHLTNIYRKLGVQNRASAVRFALENGLVAA
jgi:DNA-binding CsgD family transcriptional regulator